MGSLTERSRLFQENGYMIVPEVLTKEEVKSLRSFLRPRFLQPAESHFAGDSNKFLFDLFNRYANLQWLLAKEKTNIALREVLGEDFVILRESAAHYRLYGPWHKDTTAQEMAGHNFQWDEDYLMVEVGFYLQDNTPEFGGGLDVEVGSHRTDDPFVHAARSPSVAKRLLNRVIPTKDPQVREAYTVPSKAGDLVIFDFRINHRATPLTKQPVSEDDEKIAIFYAASRNTRHVKAYHDYLATRSDYQYLQNHSNTPELLNLAASCNLRLS